jgi:hypothetical protein
MTILFFTQNDVVLIYKKNWDWSEPWAGPSLKTGVNVKNKFKKKYYFDIKHFKKNN